MGFVKWNYRLILTLYKPILQTTKTSQVQTLKDTLKMRTKRIKLYKFNELSESAKQKAIQGFREDEDYSYLFDEAYMSLKKFASVFEIKINEFDFLENYRSKYSFELDDNILELSGLRLRTYLINNYYDTLFARKPYGKYEKRNNGKWRYDRYSNCQKIETCCPFTGVCYDEDLLQEIREFIKNPSKNTDFKDLLENCLSSICNSMKSEIKERNKDAAIAETIEANEYEFLESGEMSSF